MATPEDVAIRIRLPRPLSPEQRLILQDAIDDALAAATTHLRTSPIPRQYTEHGVTPAAGSWPVKRRPLIEIVSTAPELEGGNPTGRYTVVYRAGLDPQADPDYGAALRRYVLGHAESMPQVVEISPAGRRIRSAGLEGQNITYETGPQPGSGAAGAPPTLATLSPWRLLNAYQPTETAPHPLDAWWR
ncbi:hypothetical protein GCM10017673_38040 [Streptosporangium violaceochromogenes]|nr:hypothetical protein GCM10017673_38040 [Streptosporangium violaceochromogenes]